MLLELTTAIGSPFDVRKVTVHERIGEPFSVDIRCVSFQESIDLETVVGQAATFKMNAAHGVGRFLSVGGATRSWTGVVSSAEQLIANEPGPDGTMPLSTYALRIVPRLFLLGQRRNYRIFQHLSIPDIVDKLLAEWSIEPEWKIDRGQYPKLEYKTQYDETDLALFSRLLEEAGIAYMHMEIDGETKLVLSDAPTSHPVREAPPIHFESDPTISHGREHVDTVHIQHVVRPGAHQIVDYDFRNPSFRLSGEAPKAPPPEQPYEQYDYAPGAFLTEGKGGGTPNADDKGVYRYDGSFGGKRAARALEADRTGKRVVHFSTNVLTLQPGVVFSIEGHPHASLSSHKLLVSVFTLEAEANKDSRMRGTATFVADPFRPARATPKPRVHGVQSATVVGPSGAEIHTDEFGRVRVQFPWDREGKMNDESSVWIRVNQGWAGTGFGMIQIPRIGQEVLVGFLDGDCDAPIVVGRVFNQLNPVPYKLPENKTISGWKTNSSPTNGGYNEIKLEDRAAKELIYIQAQRDLHELVKRDETHRIERKHHRTVLDDQHLVVKKNKRELIEIDDHLHVKGDRYQKVDKSTSLTIGVDQQEKVGNKHALDAGKEIHLKAGDTVVIEAGSSLTIKGPGGFVHIGPGGVEIKGTMVKINSGGAAGTGSGSSPTEPKDAEEAFPKDAWEQIKD